MDSPDCSPEAVERVRVAIGPALDEFLLAMRRWGKETNTPMEIFEAERKIAEAAISALLRALSSRLSEVERDAARYRYVRRDGFQPFALVDKDAKVIVEEAADAAIDAALARGGKT